MLHALAGYVPCDRAVLAFPRDLVDLIDVDDPSLRKRYVTVRCPDQPKQHVLDVFADIPRFCQRRRVGDRERDAKDPGQ